MLKSHVDINKINKVPLGHPFEYRDVVDDNLPMEQHNDDGEAFKQEVENGKYINVMVSQRHYKDNRTVYIKI